MSRFSKMKSSRDKLKAGNKEKQKRISQLVRSDGLKAIKIKKLEQEV